MYWININQNFLKHLKSWYILTRVFHGRNNSVHQCAVITSLTMLICSKISGLQNKCIILTIFIERIILFYLHSYYRFMVILFYCDWYFNMINKHCKHFHHIFEDFLLPFKWRTGVFFETIFLLSDWICLPLHSF